MFRTLFVAPEEGGPTNTGGGQRTQHLFRALATLGEVDVLVVTECRKDYEPTLLARCQGNFSRARQVLLHRSTPLFVYPEQSQPALLRAASFNARRAYAAVEPRKRRFEPTPAASTALEALIAKSGYSVVVGRYLRNTAVSGALEQSAIPVVCDLDDLDEIVLQTRMQNLASHSMKAMLYSWHLGQLSRLLPALRRRCRHLWVSSGRDVPLVAHPSVSVLSNIPFAPRGFPSHASRSRLDRRVALFVGSYGHTVNRTGMRDFLAECWPAIRARCSDARLRIVGAGMVDSHGWEQLAPLAARTSGVEIVGPVDDLADEYAEASFAVVPVKEGAGTKIKIVEALAFGRAVVAFDHSVRGYEALVGNGVVGAATNEDMVSACLTLFERPDQRDELAARGHALAHASYSYQRFEREVVEATRRAAEPAVRGR